MAASSVIALGRHTVTGMIAASGRQFKDWSSSYRLFEKERVDRGALFKPVMSEVCSLTDEAAPVFAMMDDTLLRKKGKKVCGTQWRRDPLGPAFHTNFAWGQRFLQLSVALPDSDGSGRARAIPIDFIHAPTPTKPKRTDPLEDWEAWRKEQEFAKVSAVGARRIEALRDEIPDRKIVVAVDGGFTNSTVFRDIPENTVFIGRIRKDARLYNPPETEEERRGRKRFYGIPLQTPEQLRQDETIPWQQVEAYAAGRRHGFDVKAIPSVRWRGTKDRDALLVVIRPLAYRKSAGTRLLYRQPAYLLCTDEKLPLEQLLQAYLWRWEIELNFRDEKTVLGVGEAQVRTPRAAESVPALIVASYSFLLLAAHKTGVQQGCVPQPKWRKTKASDRLSTQQIIALFRCELWGLGMSSIKTYFASLKASTRSTFYSIKVSNAAATSLKAAVCYAFK